MTQIPRFFVIALAPAAAGAATVYSPLEPRLSYSIVMLAVALPVAQGLLEPPLYSPLRPLAAGAALALVYMVAGAAVGGLGLSPYSRAPLATVENAALALAMAAGEEVYRASLIRLGGGSPASIAVGTLMVAVARTTPAAALEPLEQLWEAVSMAAIGVAAGVASARWGLHAALALRAPLELALVYSPVLPNLSPLELAVVSIASAAVALAVMEGPGSLAPRGLPDTLALSLLALSLAVALLGNGFMGYRLLVVVSDSMAPAITRGDMVLVEEASIDEVGVGDVVVYAGPEGIPVMHRVVEVRVEDGEKLLVTKGDTLEEPDRAPVDESRLLGRVVLVIPELGRLPIAVASIVKDIMLTVTTIE